MRVNVYAEEMTGRIEMVGKEIDGHMFTGLRFYLKLPAIVTGNRLEGPFMHHHGEDDSSALTLWGKRDLRNVLREALNLLDAHYSAKPSITTQAPMKIDKQKREKLRKYCEKAIGEELAVREVFCTDLLALLDHIDALEQRLLEAEKERDRMLNIIGAKEDERMEAHRQATQLRARCGELEGLVAAKDEALRKVLSQGLHEETVEEIKRALDIATPQPTQEPYRFENGAEFKPAQEQTTK